MNILIYSGEALAQTLDLDTSLSEADYDLDGVTARLRVAPIGATDTVLAKDLTVLDADAGTITFAITAEESADLSSGMYAFQVVDETAPLVLAAGTLTVADLLTEPVTP